MRKVLVIAWAALAVTGYGLTVLLDEPREITFPTGRVSPQDPSPPSPPAPDAGCPTPEDHEDGTQGFGVVV
ncbi:hypothetical protein J7E96_02440 [Streptomyces sp. ISL-96]|uniref:hypothetical protein n=1 Tax=Streptomyces sp. ISL-96 TaxID=2819191 RepID=UPI001BEB41E6|nr:hypothetical protein [Streptomyces sp. ISL-96]MBT2487417.1 hypothetical protein [Streptomyces sp. ISL-96]